jgi:hypothetical protein
MWTRALATLACLFSLGCGGGSGGDPTGPAAQAQFTGSGTSSAPNLVRITQGVLDRDLVRVNVVIGGPTSSSDLYSFAFDLVLSDASVAAYVPGSAQAGTALQGSGGQQISVLASQSGPRVVVGVSKLGGGSGNGIGSGEPTIVSLAFRVLRRDVTSLTFGGSSVDPTSPNANPVALNSQGSVITSVKFDTAAVRLAGL